MTLLYSKCIASFTPVRFPHVTMSSALCPSLMATYCTLTFYTAAARLQHPGIHVCLGVGEQLVSSQVCVMRRGNEVVTQRLLHVLIHLIVQRVENVTRWTAHETCKTCWKNANVQEINDITPVQTEVSQQVFGGFPWSFTDTHGAQGNTFSLYLYYYYYNFLNKVSTINKTFH